MIEFDPDMELEWWVGPALEIQFEAYEQGVNYWENLPTDLPEPPEAA